MSIQKEVVGDVNLSGYRMNCIFKTTTIHTVHTYRRFHGRGGRKRERERALGEKNTP